MDATPTRQNRRATRSSLACLPCRSRHLKCDGKQPRCGRCSEVGSQCSYARSRRGDRRRTAPAVCTKPVSHSSLQRAPTGRPEECPTQPLPVDDIAHEPDVLLSIEHSVPRAEDTVHSGMLENDPLIDSYYKNFQTCHPFVLPRKHLMKRCQDLNRQQHDLAALVATLRFMGSIYSAREWSIPLKDDVEASLSLLSPSDPVQVHCRILYSIALFWYDCPADAQLQMDRAAKLAIDLHMFRAEFAASQGADDCVHRESWRRTWWMLYILDAYYAGTQGTMNFRVMDVDVTAELPCDESDYESGVSSINNPLFIDLCWGQAHARHHRTFQHLERSRNLITANSPPTVFTSPPLRISLAPCSVPQPPYPQRPRSPPWKTRRI